MPASPDAHPTTARRLVLPSALMAIALASPGAAGGPRELSEILAASTPSDWRRVDPQDTVYLELQSGRVVIELAPQFAPRHADNVRALARAGYFDGAVINRAQDNFVVQWSDLTGTRPLGGARKHLSPEFARASEGLPFRSLPDPDTYAPETGFASGFPAARDPQSRTAWLAHCYGMLGAGREEDASSGGGTELYVVTGHAPRQLDRNVTLLGRVLTGMDLLASLPRGRSPGGYYERSEQHVPVLRMRVAADVPQAERLDIEVMRTDSAIFAELIDSRRNRPDPWFKVSANRIDICNIPIPARIRRSRSTD